MTRDPTLLEAVVWQLWLRLGVSVLVCCILGYGQT